MEILHFDRLINRWFSTFGFESRGQKFYICLKFLHKSLNQKPEMLIIGVSL